MFKKIKGIIGSGESGGEDSLVSIKSDKNGAALGEEQQISVIALLIYIASIDEEVTEEEAESICLLSEYNLGLSQEEVPALVEKALEMRRVKSKIDDIALIVNKSFSVEQRVRIVAMLWKLVMADNKIERSEEKGIVKISTIMQLSLDQAEEARNLAEEGKV